MSDKKKTTGEDKERQWEVIQIKVFTSWINNILEKRELHIDDIQKDLCDGVKLIHFLELLSGKKVRTRWEAEPNSRIVKIQNLHIALTFLEKELTVKLVGIGAEDFADGNLKMILGFLWSMYKKYKISVIKHQDKSSEEGLLLWVQTKTKDYKECKVPNYKTGFKDGRAFLALCDAYIQDKSNFDYNNLMKMDNNVANLNMAFDTAEKTFGVPKLLDADDVASGQVDERSLILYSSLYFHAFLAKEQQKRISRRTRKTQKRNARNGRISRRKSSKSRRSCPRIA